MLARRTLESAAGTLAASLCAATVALVACTSFRDDEATAPAPAAPVVGDAGPDGATGSSDSSGSSGTNTPPPPPPSDAGNDHIRTVFVTAGFTSGALGGIAGADAKCAEEAAKSTHPAVTGRTFKAWLSVANDDVASRLVHGTLPYVTPVKDGMTVVVAQRWGALRVDLERPLERDQHGALVNSLYYAWTGSTSEGLATEPACNAWTSASEGLQGIVGATFETDTWSTFGPKSCAEAARLICVEI